MNELPATVVDGHTVRVLDVPVHVTRGTELNADSQAMLLVRPEDTHFVKNGEQGLAGHVVGQTFQGVSTTVAVRLKTLDTLVDVHEVGSVEGRLEPGDEVKVTLDGHHAASSRRSADPSCDRASAGTVGRHATSNATWCDGGLQGCSWSDCSPVAPVTMTTGRTRRTDRPPRTRATTTTTCPSRSTVCR